MKEFDLNRFIKAQEPCYAQVVHELRSGRKQTHWMWYIFPQLKGLGLSYMSKYYGIESLEEAQAYVQHDLLRGRLLESVGLLLLHNGKPIVQIMGAPDDLKLRSCLTLFEQVLADPSLDRALTLFFSGERDQKTLALLATRT